MDHSVFFFVSIDCSQCVRFFTILAGDNLAISGNGSLYVCITCLFAGGIRQVLDESEHFCIGPISILNILWINEVGTGIDDFSLAGTPIITAVLIQQIQVFGTCKDFCPSHAADERIHTSDSIIMVPSGEFGFYTLYYENRLFVIFGSKGVVYHKIVAAQQIVFPAFNDFCSVFSRFGSIFGIRLFIGTTHVQINS